MAESAATNLSESEKEEYKWEMHTALKKTKPFRFNIQTAEAQSINRLKKDNSIKILPADKGNVTIVIDNGEYKKINDLISSRNYKELTKDPTISIE